MSGRPSSAASASAAPGSALPSVAHPCLARASARSSSSSIGVSDPWSPSSIAVAISRSVRPAISTFSGGSRPVTARKASSKAWRPWPAPSTSVPSMSQSTSSTSRAWHTPADARRPLRPAQARAAAPRRPQHARRGAAEAHRAPGRPRRSHRVGPGAAEGRGRALGGDREAARGRPVADGHAGAAERHDQRPSRGDQGPPRPHPSGSSRRTPAPARSGATSWSPCAAPPATAGAWTAGTRA